MARYMNKIATWNTVDPAGRHGRRRALREAAAQELHRRPRLGQAAEARHPAQRAGRRRHVSAARLSGRHRPPAHARRSAGVSDQHRADEARRADRRAAGPAGVRRLLGQQVGRPAAAESVSRRHQADDELRRLDSRRVPPEQALRSVRPRAGHGPGQHVAQRRGHAVSRSPHAGRNHAGRQPAVSRHPAGMRQVPSPSVRGLEPGRFLQPGRLLRPRDAQGRGHLAADLRRRGDRLRRRERLGHASAHAARCSRRGRCSARPAPIEPGDDPREALADWIVVGRQPVISPRWPSIASGPT